MSLNQTTDPTANPGSIAGSLAAPIEVGEPQIAANLAVFPLIYAGATLDYTSLAAAGEQVAITERAGDASVNDLTVTNAGPRNVLLYEGEELLGAQQNRVVDVSILLAPDAEGSIPVSCVERGRWDGSRHGERFRRAGRAADGDLRRKKKRAMVARAAAGQEARSSQAEVWEEVDQRQTELAAPSPTDSLSDVFDHRRVQLGELVDAVSPIEGQCGAVAAVDGEIIIVDLVSRPEVFADLHPALVAGYALDALRTARPSRRAPPPAPPPLATVRGLSLLIADAEPSSRQAVAGLGETAYFSTAGVAGSALIAEGELIQLSAYPRRGSGPASGGAGRRARIRRPSQRRRDR